jgi:hypothetical protein
MYNVKNSLITFAWHALQKDDSNSFNYARNGDDDLRDGRGGKPTYADTGFRYGQQSPPTERSCPFSLPWRKREMKRIDRRPLQTTFRLACVSTLGLLFLSAAAKADAVLEWNAIAVNTTVANTQNPFAQARTAAITQLAVFEAVNSITGEYHPYLQGIVVAPPGASADAATIQAAYRVLITFFLRALGQGHRNCRL